MNFFIKLYVYNFAVVTFLMVAGLSLEYWLSGPITRSTVFCKVYYRQSAAHWFFNCCLPVIGIAVVLRSLYTMLAWKITDRINARRLKKFKEDQNNARKK